MRYRRVQSAGASVSIELGYTTLLAHRCLHQPGSSLNTMLSDFFYCGFNLWLSFKESACKVGDPEFNSWFGKIHWRRDSLPTPIFLGFSCGSAGKESACNVGDPGLTPGLGRSLGEGKGYTFHYSGLENSMGCIVHGVAKSQT